MQDLLEKAQHHHEKLTSDLLNIKKQHLNKEEEEYEKFRITNLANISNVKLRMKKRRIFAMDSSIYGISWSRDSSLVVSVARGGNLAVSFQKE